MAKDKASPFEMKPMTDEEFKVLEEGYYDKIETDLKYSLAVDPQNKYHMSETHKMFVSNYIRFKNVPLAAKLTGIDEETAMEYFDMYSTKQEIRRLNLALYHRSFATKMLNLNEVGGYLTSLIIGENIADAEQLSPRDKLQAAKMIMDIHRLKQEGLNDPANVIEVDIQDQLSDLSVETIKAMLDTSEKKRQENQESEKAEEREQKVWQKESKEEAEEYYESLAKQKEEEKKTEEKYEALKNLSKEEILSMLKEGVEKPSELSKRLAELKKKQEENKKVIPQEEEEEDDYFAEDEEEVTEGEIGKND